MSALAAAIAHWDWLLAGIVGCVIAGAAIAVLLLREGLHAYGREYDAIGRAEAQSHHHAAELAELHSQLAAARAVVRGQQNTLNTLADSHRQQTREQASALSQQAEIAQLATDAAESLLHEHARLTDALIDACALLEGRPAQWRAVGDRYSVPAGAPDLVNAVRPRVLAEFRALIAEVQAATEEPPVAAGAPRTRQPPVAIERHLRLVAGREARPATAAEPLITTGPIGA